MYVCVMIWPPLGSTLFPYTTLFRSKPPDRSWRKDASTKCSANGAFWVDSFHYMGSRLRPYGSVRMLQPVWSRDLRRSEEHTSELQSRLHLVCRLLLEKKNKEYFILL